MHLPLNPGETDAASMFQSKINQKNANQEVLSGNRDALNVDSTSTRKSSVDLGGERRSSVKDAANMFQSKLNEKDEGQRVLQGKKDAAEPAIKRNFVIKKK